MSAPTSADFGFGEDEAALCEVAGRFLGDRFPATRLRELVAADHEAVYERGELGAWDRDLWDEIVAMGWSALAVPEAAGGSGLSLVGVVGLVERVGRAALPSPLLSTLSASLLLSRTEAGEPWLRSIAEGAAATIAITDESGSWSVPDCGVTAVAGPGDSLVLTGRAGFVQDAHKADHVVVQCRADEGQRLVVVNGDATGLTLEADQIVDLTRDQATIIFDQVQVGADAIVEDDAVAAIESVWPALLAIVSADLCGVAEWLLQTTVDYAKNRVQFDRPIGFFQAVKHPLVDVMIDIDRARSLLYHAACSFDSGDPGALAGARMAKSAASDAAGFAADRAVQLHGGIGFTWEHDVHIYFKRAMHDQALYGGSRYQRRELARAMFV